MVVFFVPGLLSCVCSCQPLYLTDTWVPVILFPISVADSCVYVMVLLGSWHVQARLRLPSNSSGPGISVVCVRAD